MTIEPDFIWGRQALTIKKMLVAALAAVALGLLAWVLLAPFFYLCFVPGRVVLWIMGRDPLDRKIDPDRPSYWAPYRNAADERRYKRQY